jgi:tetratricopeptide (TPR) repeat protein
VNAKRNKPLTILLVFAALSQAAADQTVPALVRQGNNLYGQNSFTDAIELYDQALIQQPRTLEPKFNKADCYYRLDDLTQAADIFRQVAAESKDIKLAAKALYNLGNCHFQQGIRQKDSKLKKAVEELENSITHWRRVLEIEPDNEKAARNIEVARLIIKDIMDQLNKQKQAQDPNQPQDPNQTQNQQQNTKQQDRQQGAQQQDQQQNQTDDANQPHDPNQQQQDKQQQAVEMPDTTADEILEKEREQRKQRQMPPTGGYRKVEKDW